MTDDRRTICLDFDGVLHIGAGRWEGVGVVSGRPHPDALAWVLAALDDYHVVVFSGRSAVPEGIAAMRAWLAGHSFPVDRMDFPATKPLASLFIDDRGWRFEGAFPELGTEPLMNWEERERARARALRIVMGKISTQKSGVGR